MNSNRSYEKAAIIPEAPRRDTDADTSELLLSPRECEIARLVAAGYPNKTIGGILEISPWTVATHVRRIFNKLGVHGRASMVARLAQNGFRFQRPPPVPGPR